MSLTMTILDVCLPCYFQGFSHRDGRALLAVSVAHDSDASAIIDALVDDWRGSDPADGIPDSVTDDAVREAATNVIGEAVARKLCADIEPDGDDDSGEAVYLYCALDYEPDDDDDDN